METHKSNSKKPVTSNNGNEKISGTSGNDAADKNNLSANLEKKGIPVIGDIETPANERTAKNTNNMEESLNAPAEDKMDLNRKQDEVLTPILSVSQRFMSNLRKGFRGKSSGMHGAKGKAIDKEGDQNQAPRRLRDWDTRLFVLSTLKRMVDREHFEEMDEEENRTPLTREALQNRKRLMVGRDQRQRRRKKDEKLIPTSRLTNKITDESTLLNTRDKQHIEKSRNVQEQGRKVKAGMALNDALQKVIAIKNPHSVSEMPEVKQNNELIEPKNEVTEHFREIDEQHNELKEQNRTKRGFFNFTGKKK